MAPKDSSRRCISIYSYSKQNTKKSLSSMRKVELGFLFILELSVSSFQTEPMKRILTILSILIVSQLSAQVYDHELYQIHKAKAEEFLADGHFSEATLQYDSALAVIDFYPYDYFNAFTAAFNDSNMQSGLVVIVASSWRRVSKLGTMATNFAAHPSANG